MVVKIKIELASGLSFDLSADEAILLFSELNKILNNEKLVPTVINPASPYPPYMPQYPYYPIITYAGTKEYK